MVLLLNNNQENEGKTLKKDILIRDSTVRICNIDIIFGYFGNFTLNFFKNLACPSQMSLLQHSFSVCGMSSLKDFGVTNVVMVTILIEAFKKA